MSNSNEKVARWRAREKLRKKGVPIPMELKQQKTGRKRSANYNAEHGQYVLSKYHSFGAKTFRKKRKTHCNEKVKRWRAREHLKKEGVPIPVELNVQKTGRKRCDTFDLPRREKDLERYYTSKAKSKHSICTSQVLYNKRLRRRTGSSNTYILDDIGDKLCTWSERLCHSEQISERSLKQSMKQVINDAGKCFKWLQTQEQSNLLVFVTTFGGDTFFHPWVEVRKSDISIGNEFSYGLFAARNFPANSEIGLYLGIVTSAKEVIGEGRDSEFLLLFRERYFVDIPDNSIKRLCYGIGSHMVNDSHWKATSENRNDDKNNAEICENLLLVAKNDIKVGDEITVNYYLDM